MSSELDRERARVDKLWAILEKVEKYAEFLSKQKDPASVAAGKGVMHRITGWRDQPPRSPDRDR